VAEKDEIRFTPEFAAELQLVRAYSRDRYGDRRPTSAEFEDVLAALSDRLPLSNKLLHELTCNDPDGTLAQVLAALAEP